MELDFVTTFFGSAIIVAFAVLLWQAWLRRALKKLFRRSAHTCYNCASKYQLTTELSDIIVPCDICNEKGICTWTSDLERYIPLIGTPINMQLKQLRRRRIGEKRQNEI
ncbi:hypothetical protein LCGC14_1620230 [marine sediment metagenome]|uniref:Uncharacterized protein n=1 Tax=marine sediment metagenome TaxID=412755 RepID=A0A0F9ISK5_9ZZZZ